MFYPQNQGLRAYASYLFLSTVLGATEWIDGSDGRLAVRATPDREPPSGMSVRLASRNADRIGSVAAADHSGSAYRIAVWSYPRFMATDERLADHESTVRVDIPLPPRPDRPWHLRVLGYEHQRPFPVDADVPTRSLRIASLPGLPLLALRETDAAERLTLTMTPGALYFVDAR
jgi:hypothetical protein